MRLYKKLGLALACATFLVSPALAAEEWPTKPMMLMVPNSVGGMADVTARIMADGLLKILGQPMVVQNKPGAGGQVCMQYVARSPADGYTIFSGNMTQPLAMGEITGKRTIKLDDYEVVGGFLPNERALYIHNDAPYSNWDEFVAYAKAHPDTVSIGFGGNQQSLELLKYVTAKAGIKCRLINYKSGGDASADFFGKHIDMVELGVGTAVYQAAVEGKAKMLALTSDGKIPGFDAPRLMDKGYPYPVLTEYGMLMPKGTPKAIVKKLEKALEATLQDPEIMAKMKNLGAPARFISGDDLRTRCADVVRGVAEMTAAQ